MSTSSKVDEEARIEFESTFNIFDGEELTGTLSVKRNFVPTL